jgi:hypothetical protein
MCGVDAAADRAPLPADRAQAPSTHRARRRRVDGAERRVLRHAVDRGSALLRPSRSGGDPGLAGGANAGGPARRDQLRVGGRARAQGVPGTGRGIRRPVDAAFGRDRRCRRMAAAASAPVGAAGSLRRSRRGAGAHGALAERRACRRTARGAGLRRAGNRQEPSSVSVGVRRARRGVRSLVGRVLRGAGGAVRAVDRRVLAARRARPDRGPRAARRAARRRACATGARPAAAGARNPGAGELRPRDRALPALLGRVRSARGARGVRARVPGARRRPLGRRAVGRADEARDVIRRIACTPGDPRLPRLGPRHGSSAERRAPGSAAGRGCRADRAGRVRCDRGVRGDGGGRRARARCGRTDARGGDRKRDRRQPVLRRRGAAQPGGVGAAHVRLGDRAMERRPIDATRSAASSGWATRPTNS